MKNNLKKSILDKIETEEIKPISKSHFDWQNRTFWIILILSLVFAAIFGTFLFDDSLDFWRYGRGTSFSPFFFIPHLIWLTVISILIFLGIKEYRKTSSWYKTSTWIIALILLIILFFGSFAFRWFGIWQFFRHNMIEKTPLNNYIYNFSTWNSPENWRLAWTIIYYSWSEIKLKDTADKIWIIELKDAFVSPMVNLNSWEKIRVFWSVNEDNKFLANKIAPETWKWMNNWIWGWRWRWINR